MYEEKPTAKQMLSKLTFDLIRKQPFFGEVLVRLRDAAEVSYGTAYATPERIGYNPKFIETLPQEEANFVFLHELCHVIWQHAGRVQNRSCILWNIATDIVINEFLVNSKCEFNDAGIKLEAPESMLRASHFPVIKGNVSDLSAEKVYDMLASVNEDLADNDNSQIQEMPDGTGMQGNGSTQSGKGAQGSYGQQDSSSDDSADENEDENSAGDENETVEEQNGSGSYSVNTDNYGKQKEIPESIMDISRESGKPANDQPAADAVKRIVTEVQMHTQFSGRGAAGLMQELKDLMGTKIPWHKYVRRYLTSKEDSEESYDTPNRNFLWKKEIYPGIDRDDESKLTDIIIAVDTSGSVFYDKKMLSEFFYQVNCLVRDFELEGRVITWDDGVGDDVKLENSADFTKTIKQVVGGGGTNIAPLMQYVRKTYRHYTALIVLTDGWFFDCGEKRLRDTLIVIPKDENTNWKSLGRVVAL